MEVYISADCDSGFLRGRFGRVQEPYLSTDDTVPVEVDGLVWWVRQEYLEER